MTKRLTLGDREIIETLRKSGQSWRKIGLMMGRDHSVVMREYKRNRMRGGVYDAEKAQIKTKARTYKKKKESNKIRGDDVLNSYILKHLEDGKTAEAIAGRWNEIDGWLYADATKISGMSIRRYINGKYGSYIKFHLISLDRLKKYKKQAKRGKREGGKIPNRIFVNDRPQIIGDKLETGHFEVDFIVSTQGDSTVILVLIDKQTRFRIGLKLPDRKSETVKNALVPLINKREIKSLTFDNDTGFVKHELLGIPTYFCHTYSSWEKGQVEWGNKGYRIFRPKSTKLAYVLQNEIDIALERMNDYPLKCLGYRTPKEMRYGYSFNQITTLQLHQGMIQLENLKNKKLESNVVPNSRTKLLF